MSLGTNISRLRAENNLSQGDLAEALGVSRQSVSKWETDASIPDLDKLVKLSQLFGITLDELVTGAVLENPEEPFMPTPVPEITTAPARAFPPRKIVGTILLCTGLLVTLVLAVMGGLLEGLILALPFLLCGGICLLFRRRIGLWCVWALYLLIDLYLRFATGINFRLAFYTLSFTPEMNYARLAIAWVQLLVMLLLIGVTIFSYRKERLPDTQRTRSLLIVGWAAFFLLKVFAVKWFFGRWFAYSLSISDDLLLPLLTALLTATVCLFRSRKEQ